MMPRFFMDRSSAADGIEWISELPQPAEAEWVSLRGHAGMIPQDDGAILAWHFNDAIDGFTLMYVRLNEDEANAVYEADPYRVGLLEPVRRRLENPWAVLIVLLDGQMDAAPFRIPHFGSESRFLRLLDREAVRMHEQLRVEVNNSIPMAVPKRLEFAAITAAKYAALS